MMDIFYPVKLLADWISYSVLPIGHDTLLAKAINFFIFDTIKILILISVVIFVVSVIRSFFLQNN